MATVELKNVKKIYDNAVTAVRDASLKMDNGEFIVLVGPSGCGKSTLLRMIAGLEEISAGTIEIGDTVVNEVPPKDRNIAMVFQNYALYPHMTVRENMSFGLKLRKFAKEEIEKRVNNAAEILNITDYLERKPKALSGGQRQRVAVGRAIVRQPEVFLFDEPLSNLDAKLRVQMRIEITRLHQKLKSTMVYVTHDQVEAMTMGDRIVVMNNGVIQQVDTPLNLYNKPVNRFVAGFIGSPAMNFIEGTIEVDKNIVFKHPNFTLTLTSEQMDFLKEYKGKKVTMGIRPEHLFVAADKADFSVETDVLEPMGNEIIAYFSLGETPLVVRCPADTKLTIGQKVQLNILQNAVHFFETETGNRLE